MTKIDQQELKRVLGGLADRGDTERLAQATVERAGREGLIDVAYTTIDTPFGETLVAQTDRGLIRVAFPHRRGETTRDWEALLEEISEVVSPRILEAPARLDDARRQLDEYFEGKRKDFDLDIDWRLTRGFQSKAIRQIARIPYGRTLTYTQLAKKAGSPRAVRAVGTACGANPLPPIVPCHRVLPATGGIGNYGGGPDMKKALLKLEGALD